jgi:hypothetical protein
MGGDEVGDWKEWLGWCLPGGQSGFERMVELGVESGSRGMTLGSEWFTWVTYHKDVYSRPDHSGSSEAKRQSRIQVAR